jgi:hypothetical protein
MVGRDARVRRLAATLLVPGALAACRATPAPSEPRAERAPATSPADLLPDDLDFVLRIDAARIRQNPALAGVVRELVKTKPSELLASIQGAFAQASAVWVGTRWMSDGFHGDGVVAIEAAPGGDKIALAISESRASRRRLLALSDVDVFERPTSARGEAALEIVMGNRGVVLATAAEADAVLRVLRGGADEGRLEPSARGLVSFAGRFRGGAPVEAAATTGTLRAVAQGLVGYAGSLDEGTAAAGEIAVEVSLVYVSAKDAARAAERAKETAGRLAAAGGSLGTMANSVRLNELGSAVQLRCAVPFAWLAELH